MSKTTKAMRTLREDPIYLKPKRTARTKKEKFQEQLHKDTNPIYQPRPERDDALFLQTNIRI